MLKTKHGDYYTPKEVLKIILKAKHYDLSVDYTLSQAVYGGFFIKKKEEEFHDVPVEKA